MKNKFVRKTRFSLSAATGLLVASGSVVPLTMATSCSQDKIIDNHIDKEYGVSKETYEDLKEQFRIAYAHKLEKDYEIGSNDYNIRMNALEEDLNVFDKASNYGKNGYTATTSALIDFAREHHQEYPTGNATETEPYGIRLVRHTRTKWSDLNDLYAGMADSFKTYMHNNKIPTSTINRIMVESKTKFDDLTKQLKATYGNDALAGLLKAKEQVITFFDEVNDDIAFISAALRLKDFFNEFELTYRDDVGDANCLDILEQNPKFKVDQVLDDEMMNQIFFVTRVTTGQKIEFNSKTMIPGYIVSPKLAFIHKDEFRNNYSIYIDFGLVKNVYAQRYANDPERLELVTGRCYQLDLSSLQKNDLTDEATTLADIIRSCKSRPFETMVHLTAKGERDALERTYFNTESEYGNISFKWDRQHEAYEAFFDNARQNKDGTWTGTLDAQSLANAGLMISCDDDSYVSLTNEYNKDINNEDLNNVSLFDVFVENCALKSNVYIDESDQNNKIVEHNFIATYSNSKYTTKGSEAFLNVDNDYYESTCINFKTSDNFYQKINDKFNQAARFVIEFDNSLEQVDNHAQNGEKEDRAKIAKLKKEAKMSYIFQVICLCSTIVEIGFLVIAIWKPISGGRTTGIQIVCFIISLISLIGSCIDFNMFEKHYYNPINDYVYHVSTAYDNLEASELVKILKTDLAENFVLINDDGTYDKVKYAQQKAKFDKKHMSDMLNMYRKYSSIFQYDEHGENSNAQKAMHDFKEILTLKESSVDDFIEKFDNWKPFKGVYWWLTMSIQLGIAIGVLIGDIFLKRAVRRSSRGAGRSQARELRRLQLNSGNDHNNLFEQKLESFTKQISTALQDVGSSFIDKTFYVKELALKSICPAMPFILLKTFQSKYRQLHNEILMDDKYNSKIPSQEEVYKVIFKRAPEYDHQYLMSYKSFNASTMLDWFIKIGKTKQIE